MCLVLVAAATLPGRRAHAQGFQLNRFEPSAPGNPFFGVSHPWYSSTRYLAGGLNFDYNHNALLGGKYVDGKFEERASVVEHQLVGRLEVAGSFLDRVQLSLTFPIVLLERGEAAYGVGPNDGVVASDIRLSGLARIWRHADQDPISIHAGFHFWIPVQTHGQHAGDALPRGAPEVVLAGVLWNRLRWAFSTAFVFRGVTRLGDGPTSHIGSELQLRAAVGWTDPARRWNVGPEAWLATAITSDAAGRREGTSLEVLLGGQYQIVRMFQVSAGIGTALASALGVPDVRFLFRFAYAPIRPKKAGDRDGDGMPDAQDVCPDVSGESGARGCPDRDVDGVPDAEDLCPSASMGRYPEAGRNGCPSKDEDQDGVPDAQDVCPGQSAGANPEPGSSGCPAKDSDVDGVPDHQDLCPTAASGSSPDPARSGCPLPDKDGDGVPDERDACPILAGVADADRRRSGCPRLDATTTELRSISFGKNEAVLLPESFPVLDEVATLLASRPDVLVVEIAGHADDTGADTWNMRLSRLRAEAVVRYLIEHGVEKKRLRSVGYGDSKPLSREDNEEARARNRRVEMRVPIIKPR